MVNIEINGKTIEAPEGSMVIEAADSAGITIPRFCYHSKLSLAASCRMCLVEVEKIGKPQPACATPVSEGMKVFTRSPKAIASQRAVMEFLLINHPLDCPICDQGGECDLQEMAMGYGQDASNYSETKRIVKDKDIGPVISTDLTRCIQCTRCVRFGSEIAGLMELGAPGRGEHMHIGTFVENGVTSELAGNLADICPVGSLTIKPYRYKGRPWELSSHSTISLHDSVGANMRVDIRRGEIMRVVPRDNEAVNETWISDRDRFSYQAVTHKDRILRPRIKTDGKWHDVDWDRALTFAATGLKDVVEKQGAEKIGALSGTLASNEELYLLQKFMRGVGSQNIDYRLKQVDFSNQNDAPVFPWLGQSLIELETVDAALVVGSNTRLEQPLVATRLRKAARNGAHITFVNPAHLEQHMSNSETMVAAPAKMAETLAAIAKAAASKSGKKLPQVHQAFITSVSSDESHESIAQTLLDSANSTVLTGNLLTYHPKNSLLTQLSLLIAELTDSKPGYIADGGNSVGAAMAGVLPHRTTAGIAVEQAGLNWHQMTQADLNAYLIMSLEPEFDTIDPVSVTSALASADFTVVMSSYDNASINEYANVVLPVSTYFETSGSAVNNEGIWQNFNSVIEPFADSRPAWKVLRVLGNLLDVNGFEYMSISEVSREVEEACKELKGDNSPKWSAVTSTDSKVDGLQRIISYPIYLTDAMSRRSSTLQQTAESKIADTVRVNQTTAANAGVSEAQQVQISKNGHSVIMPVMIDNGVPDGCIYLPVANAAVAGFGADIAGFKLQSV